MMKDIVVLDIDGVVADFEQSLVDYLCGKHGYLGGLKRDEYELEKRFEKYPHILKDALWFVNDPNSYYAIKPYQWMSEFANLLTGADFWVVYATVRPESSRSITRRWMVKHGFPYTDDTAIFGAMNKSVELDEIKERVAFVVDDSPKQLINLLSAGFPVLCTDRTWNAGMFPRLIVTRSGEYHVWRREDEEEIGFDEFINKMEVDHE